VLKLCWHNGWEMVVVSMGGVGIVGGVVRAKGFNTCVSWSLYDLGDKSRRHPPHFTPKMGIFAPRNLSFMDCKKILKMPQSL